METYAVHIIDKKSKFNKMSNEHQFDGIKWDFDEKEINKNCCTCAPSTFYVFILIWNEWKANKKSPSSISMK